MVYNTNPWVNTISVSIVCVIYSIYNIYNTRWVPSKRILLCKVFTTLTIVVIVLTSYMFHTVYEQIRVPILLASISQWIQGMMWCTHTIHTDGYSIFCTGAIVDTCFLLIMAGCTYGYNAPLPLDTLRHNIVSGLGMVDGTGALYTPFWINMLTLIYICPLITHSYHSYRFIGNNIPCLVIHYTGAILSIFSIIHIINGNWASVYSLIMTNVCARSINIWVYTLKYHVAVREGDTKGDDTSMSNSHSTSSSSSS